MRRPLRSPACARRARPRVNIHAVSTRAAVVAMVVAASTWAGPSIAQDGKPEAPLPTEQPAAEPTGEETGRPDADDEGTDPRVLFGGIAIGVGLTAVLVGSVIGVVAAAKYGDLDCPDDLCPPDLHDDADDYNDLRAPSEVTIFVGAIATLVGAALLIDYQRETSAVEVKLSPTFVGVEGRF